MIRPSHAAADLILSNGQWTNAGASQRMLCYSAIGWSDLKARNVVCCAVSIPIRRSARTL